jgi:radical SAM-linked protein
MVGDKIRFRFRKVGDLRLLSHLDLTRCVERMLRRAQIPFASTLGFHPTPRMVFCLAMPLGCEAWSEVLELELTEPRDSEEILTSLNAQCPRGLEFTSATVIPKKLTAIPRRVNYTLPIPQDRVEECQRVINRTMLDSQVWVDRYKPKPRSINIRPYLRDLSLIPLNSKPTGRSSKCDSISSESVGDGIITPRDSIETINGFNLRPLGFDDMITPHLLTLDLWVTQTGTARADELLKLLEVSDLLDEGYVLSRSLLEVRDETPATEGGDQPPEAPPEIRPLNHAPAVAGTDDEPAPTWGMSPNGPIVE